MAIATKWFEEPRATELGSPGHSYHAMRILAIQGDRLLVRSLYDETGFQVLPVAWAWTKHQPHPMLWERWTKEEEEETEEIEDFLHD